MPGKFSFVYFDLDDTLLDHHSAQREALRELHAEFFENVTNVGLADLQRDYHDGNVVLWKQYSLAEITGEQLRFRRFASLCDRYDVQFDPIELSDRYMNLYARHWVALPNAERTFDAIAAAVPVGIITNGFAATQREKLERFSNFRDTSASIVISEEFGHMKPSLKLFEFAQLQAKCSPEEILYVGDSWHSDVEGGLAAGWNVAWFSSQPAESQTSGIDTSSRLFQFSEWSDLIDHCALDV